VPVSTLGFCVDTSREMAQAHRNFCESQGMFRYYPRFDPLQRPPEAGPSLEPFKLTEKKLLKGKDGGRREERPFCLALIALKRLAEMAERRPRTGDGLLGGGRYSQTPDTVHRASSSELNESPAAQRRWSAANPAVLDDREAGSHSAGQGMPSQQLSSSTLGSGRSSGKPNSALARIAGFASAGRASLDANAMANLATSAAARRQQPQKRLGKVAARPAPRPKSSMFAEYDADPGSNLPPRAKSALSALHPPQRAPHDSPLPDGVTPPPSAAVAAWGALTGEMGEAPASAGEMGEEPGDVRSKERQVRARERVLC